MKLRKIKNVSCREAAKFICENLNEKSDSPLCRQIKKHLRECPDCSCKLSSLKKIVSLYKNYPEALVSGITHKALMARLSSIKH